VAGVAFLVGVVVGAMHVPEERQEAEDFARAWQRGNYSAMYRLLSESSRRRISEGSFAQALQDARDTATAKSLRVGDAEGPDGGEVTVPVRVRTRIFGTLRGNLRIPFEDSGDGKGIVWSSALTFPGLGQGELIQRRVRLARRGSILAADGTPLAKGSDRDGALSEDVLGTVEPPPARLRDELRPLGFPPDAPTGIFGLERALNSQLAGTPGGELLAGERVIARSPPRPGVDVRTTIDPRLTDVAVDELNASGRSGGIAVLKPQTGEIIALAGLGLDGLQPPGSTFKIITTTAALEDRKVKLTDRFPVESATTLSGVTLSNASGELCGGSFVDAFAHSCNSVFGPLGVKIGARRLVEVAARYGWNRPPQIEGAAMPTIPPADQIGDDLAIGSTAIGQGKVLTTALGMASVAATIANRGVRAEPTLVPRPRPRRRPAGTRVTSPQIAATIRKLMIDVVRFGTGKKARLPGVQVAGKTGTAEIGGTAAANQDPTNSDAWFVSFAPARAPRIVVGVMLIRAGAGGDYAAPVAADVMRAALRRF
jgi:cell division protein FtsI/penicillin-binding protein 2